MPMEALGRDKPWIFFDQDGTLNEWRWIETAVVRRPGYFRTCVPRRSVIGAVSLLCKEEDIIVGTYGAVWDDGHSRCDKDWWMETHCPCISDDRRFYVPCGSEKASLFDKLLGRPIRRGDILVDDCSEVLRSWETYGGTGVKIRTAENGRFGTWKGLSFDGREDPAFIASYLLRIARQINHQEEREVFL